MVAGCVPMTGPGPAPAQHRTRRPGPPPPGRTPAVEEPPAAARPLPDDAPAGTVLHVVGVHLHLERGGKVLLRLRHPDSAYAGGWWHALAGHLEAEAAAAGLARDAFEKAGLVIDPADLELVHTVHTVDRPGAPPRIQLFFRPPPLVRHPPRNTNPTGAPPEGPAGAGRPPTPVSRSRAAGPAAPTASWDGSAEQPRGGRRRLRRPLHAARGAACCRASGPLPDRHARCARALLSPRQCRRASAGLQRRCPSTVARPAQGSVVDAA